MNHSSQAEELTKSDICATRIDTQRILGRTPCLRGDLSSCMRMSSIGSRLTEPGQKISIEKRIVGKGEARPGIGRRGAGCRK